MFSSSHYYSYYCEVGGRYDSYYCEVARIYMFTVIELRSQESPRKQGSPPGSPGGLTGMPLTFASKRSITCLSLRIISSRRLLSRADNSSSFCACTIWILCAAPWHLKSLSLWSDSIRVFCSGIRSILIALLHRGKEHEKNQTFTITVEQKFDFKIILFYSGGRWQVAAAAAGLSTTQHLFALLRFCTLTQIKWSGSQILGIVSLKAQILPR